LDGYEVSAEENSLLYSEKTPDFLVEVTRTTKIFFKLSYRSGFSYEKCVKTYNFISTMEVGPSRTGRRDSFVVF